MNSRGTITIKDIKSGQMFALRPFDVTARFVTKDGVAVTVHPESIAILVPKGSEFDEHTRIGTRELKRVN